MVRPRVGVYERGARFRTCLAEFMSTLKITEDSCKYSSKYSDPEALFFLCSADLLIRLLIFKLNGSTFFCYFCFLDVVVLWKNSSHKDDDLLEG